MINILYASFACSEIYFEKKYSKSKKKPGQAIQKFNRLIMEGIAANNDVEVTSITARPDLDYKELNLISRRESEQQKGVNYIYLPSINIKIIRDFVLVGSFLFEALSFLRMKKNMDNCYILTDVLNAPVALGGFLLSRIKRVPYTIVLTDVPEYGGSGTAYTIISNFLIKYADSYVFLTEEMNTKYNVKDQPFIIMEGLVDIREHDDSDINEHYTKCNNENTKILMYAGGLNKVYGIPELVEGFIDAHIDGWELHVYGEGDYRLELEKVAKHNNNVKYFGTLMSSEIVKKEKEASLLINPRPTIEEYTKYSFPSKNMEYMVSGTPVLTTDLPGMPAEYKKYVFILEDYSAYGIENKLKEICALGCDTLNEKGIEARSFVLNKKNNIIQAKRIIDMIETI